jgi:aspartate/methionine/tyrosine aminotransferase
MTTAYGLPGLRVGWAVCRDPRLAETLLAAKEQMVICGATIDEAIAARVLTAGRASSHRFSTT